MLRDINRELATSFIMVTHDRGLAERTDHLLVMSDGMIVQDEYIEKKA